MAKQQGVPRDRMPAWKQRRQQNTISRLWYLPYRPTSCISWQKTLFYWLIGFQVISIFLKLFQIRLSLYFFYDIAVKDNNSIMPNDDSGLTRLYFFISSSTRYKQQSGKQSNRSIQCFCKQKDGTVIDSLASISQRSPSVNNCQQFQQMMQPFPMSIWQYRPFRNTFITLMILGIAAIVLGVMMTTVSCNTYSNCYQATSIFTNQCYLYGTVYCCHPSYKICGDSWCTALSSYDTFGSCASIAICLWIILVVIGVLMIALVVISCQFSNLRRAQMIIQPNYYVPPAQPIYYYANLANNNPYNNYNPNNYNPNNNNIYNQNPYNNNPAQRRVY